MTHSPVFSRPHTSQLPIHQSNQIPTNSPPPPIAIHLAHSWRYEEDSHHHPNVDTNAHALRLRLKCEIDIRHRTIARNVMLTHSEVFKAQHSAKKWLNATQTRHQNPADRCSPVNEHTKPIRHANIIPCLRHASPRPTDTVKPNACRINKLNIRPINAIMYMYMRYRGERVRPVTAQSPSIPAQCTKRMRACITGFCFWTVCHVRRVAVDRTKRVALCTQTLSQEIIRICSKQLHRISVCFIRSRFAHRRQKNGDNIA